MTKIHNLLRDRAAEYIRENGLISNNAHVLAAVSGGPDSVALLHILVQIKSSLAIERITVIHFNHRLRGQESDEDLEFVRSLALDLGLDFRSAAADVRERSREGKISLEMAARECRHSFFKEVARELNAHKIALGHTANDQAEELLLRILRGTGPAGLQGMLPGTAEGIIRPLLFATREEILEYLGTHGIEYREDRTNSEPTCQRNLLRLEVFPLLRKAFHPEIAATIARHAELARLEESWWTAQVEKSWGTLCRERSEPGVALDLNGLRRLHPAMLRRILRYGIEKVRGNLAGIGTIHLEPLFSAISEEKPGRSLRFPGDIEALQQGGRLVIRRIHPDGSQPENEPLDIPGPGLYRFGAFAFEVLFSDGTISETSATPGPLCAIMDGAKVKWPLQLRVWRPGDRFCPLGMKGSKKLQDLFTDSRIPKEERRSLPLLCDAEKICWVTGLRIDERVRVTPDTKTILIFRRLP